MQGREEMVGWDKILDPIWTNAITFPFFTIGVIIYIYIYTYIGMGNNELECGNTKNTNWGVMDVV